VANDRGLFADFWTVFFRKVFVAVRTVEVHSRPEHMRVYDENFLTNWTSDFNGLTHGLPLFDFGFAILRLCSGRVLDFGLSDSAK